MSDILRELSGYTSELKIALYVVVLIAVVLVFMAMYTYGRDTSEQIKDRKRTRKKDKEINIYFTRKRKGIIGKPEEIRAYLTKNGFDSMSVDGYIRNKIIITALTTIAFILLFGPISALIGAAVGFMVLDLLIREQNKKDNAKMTPDISIMLSTLRLQALSDVYITTGLAQCYYLVKNKRLKKAILELTGDITRKETVDEAIGKFNSKFNNKNIDGLCVAIKQLMKSGKAENMLENIAKQMAEVEEYMQEREEHEVEVNFLTASIIIFIGMILLLMILYINIASSQNIV